MQRRPLAEAAAAEGEDALDQSLCPGRGLQHLVQVSARQAHGRDMPLRELAVAEDRAEDVVEVVRDAAGERAHRLHLLRLAKLRLQAVLVRLGSVGALELAGKERDETYADEA